MTMLSISASENFVAALAHYCQNMAHEKEISLSDITIYLPTRRSVRALKSCFADLADGQAQFLPTMQSIGDADLEQVDIMMPDITDILPAIDPMHRQIALARLLEKTWPHDYSYQQSLSIAADLGRLIDQIHTENLNINQLETLIENVELAQYWELTSHFLTTLLGTIWPQYLDDLNMIDPGLHRHLTITKLASFYKSYPIKNPVIIAGSTGSIPATRDLIKTVHNLENGYVILPALDHHMSEQEWFAVGEGHSQYLIKNLLSVCNINRQDVNLIEYNGNKQREILISQAMLPAKKTENWKNLSLNNQSDIIKKGLEGITLCNADNDEQEANIIALSMLEIAADRQKKKTCVLVTSDTGIVKRVQSILSTRGLYADSSMGTPLFELPQTLYLLSVIGALNNANNINIIALLNTLKSPFMGYITANQSQAIKDFEIKLCRKKKIRGNFDDFLLAAEEEQKSTLSFLEELKLNFEPLITLQGDRHTVNQWALAHLTVAESLSKTQDTDGAERLWNGRVGDALASLFEKIMAHGDMAPPMTLAEYIDFITQFLSSETVTDAIGTHPRLSILGQIEARMVKADRVILAGLNEGTWPPDSGFDVWMSRAMRGHFGLPSLEQKTSLAAHDFYCGFCADDVFITRSEKSNGQPTLKSRWLERLETVLTAANIDENIHPSNKGDYYKSIAQNLRHTQDVQVISRPAPCPPVERRPTDYSVTQIEKFMRDPYWIYAKKILQLSPLNDLDDEVTVADRGNIIHNILEEINSQFPTADIPDDFSSHIISCGRAIFSDYNFNADIHGLWWPRFEKTAYWIADYETEWRKGTNIIYNEKKATLTIPINGKDFTLTGKIDRIETRLDNELAIIDYKTGSPPQTKNIASGLSSQLPLEAMMIEKDAFEDVSSIHDNYALYYWVLNGSGDGGKISQVNYNRTSDIQPLITQAEDGVRALFENFANAHTPYYATPEPDIKIKPDYNDYAHLQRMKEWLVQGEDE